MTAGAAEVAYAVESTYGSLAGSPDWIQPGVDVEVDGPTLENQLARQRQPDSPKAPRAREGNLTGNVTVSFTMTDSNWHELVFDASSNTELATDTSTQKPSATWYFSADVPGVNTERFALGAVVTDATIEYQQGEEVRVSLTIQFQDEDKSLTTPSSITQPSESDAFVWHGMTPKRSGTEIPEAQSLTINLSNLASPVRNQSRYIQRFTAAAHELGFDIEAIYQEEDQLEAAYGSSGNSTTQDTISQVNHSAEFVNANGTTHTFSLDNAQPTSHSWNQLVGEEDLNESVEFFCSDISVSVT